MVDGAGDWGEVERRARQGRTGQDRAEEQGRLRLQTSDCGSSSGSGSVAGLLKGKKASGSGAGAGAGLALAWAVTGRLKAQRIRSTKLLALSQASVSGAKRKKAPSTSLDST